MNEIEITKRPIEIITSEIQFYKAQAGTSLLEIGKRLNEAKEQLSHGDWLPWLRDKAEFSERTAQNLMRIAREYTNPQLVSDLGTQKALLLIALEEGEREAFASASHVTESGEEKMVQDMSTAELKKALQELEEARKQAKDIEEQLTLKLDGMAAEREETRQEHEGMIAELKEKVDKAQDQAAKQEDRVRQLEQELAAAREEAAEPDEDMLAQIRKEAAAQEAEKLKMKLNKAKEDVKKAKEAQKHAEEQMKEAEEQAKKRIKALEETARQRDQEARNRQEEAETQLRKLEKQLAASGNQDVLAFKIHFKAAQNEINTLIDCLDRMATPENAENREKLKEALRAFLECTMQNVEGEV